MSENRPVITSSKWTFDLAGACIDCGKKVKRVKTFEAATQAQAEAKAARAMEGLCHLKCGGY